MTELNYDPSRLGPEAGSYVAVAGGCGGMGQVLVKALIDTGVNVAVLDMETSLVQNPPPSDVLALAIDGSDASSVEKAFSEIANQWTRLDGFVNLIGFFKGWTQLSELPVDIFDEVISGNLRSHFLCAKAALPMLRRSKSASLVTVSSTLGMDVVKNYSHYAAAKAGVIALTKGMARENGTQVRVNAIAPGLTNTAFITGGTGREKVFDGVDPEYFSKLVPMKRMAEAQDMTGPILFLLGKASGFVNGETLIVDGGMYVQ